MKLTPELEKYLNEQGYFNLKVVDGKICGLMKFMYTIGLVVNIKEWDYEYRYCYPYANTAECLLDFGVYKYGVDPIGGWVKQKGGNIDRVNPAIEEEWLKNRE